MHEQDFDVKYQLYKTSLYKIGSVSFSGSEGKYYSFFVFPYLFNFQQLGLEIMMGPFDRDRRF